MSQQESSPNLFDTHDPMDDILKPIEVANAWNIAKGTLENWVRDPENPAPKGFKLGRGRVWRRRDVLAYIAQQERDPA